mmetsp:Transcript_11132/g.28097  ORF Transcript_11132/g.28097 Transcript_11132/m.28097 type:complete len:219 (+) Transcript_11132:950-1606(+)
MTEVRLPTLPPVLPPTVIRFTRLCSTAMAATASCCLRDKSLPRWPRTRFCTVTAARRFLSSPKRTVQPSRLGRSRCTARSCASHAAILALRIGSTCEGGLSPSSSKATAALPRRKILVEPIVASSLRTPTTAASSSANFAADRPFTSGETESSIGRNRECSCSKGTRTGYPARINRTASSVPSALSCRITAALSTARGLAVMPPVPLGATQRMKCAPQ